VPFLNALLQLVVWVYEMLRAALSNLLAFLSFLDQTARSVLQAVADFSWKLGRVMLSLTWTLLTLSLFYLPGIVLVVAFRENMALLITGIAYMVMVTLVGIFYRPEKAGVEPVRVNITWLSFFPLSWSRDGDFAPILAEFANSYDDLRLAAKNAESDLVRDALRRIMSRLEQNMKWTSKCVKKARKLRAQQGKLKGKGMVQDIEARVQTVRERLRANLEQFRRAMDELNQVNLALDEQERIFETLNPIEDEIVLLEQFKKVLQGHRATLTSRNTS